MKLTKNEIKGIKEFLEANSQCEKLEAFIDRYREADNDFGAFNDETEVFVGANCEGSIDWEFYTVRVVASQEEAHALADEVSDLLGVARK